MDPGIIAARVPIRNTRPGLLAWFLCALSSAGSLRCQASAPASRPDPDPAVTALLARMRAQEQTPRRLSFRFELTTRLFAGAEPQEQRGWLAWDSAEHLAASLTWRSEFGELFLHALRDAEGLRVRTRTPFGDERVLRARPEELALLFGPQGEVDRAGPARVCGSQLVADRSDRLRFRIVGEAVVDGVPCLELLGTGVGAPDPASFLPDRTQVWVGRDDLLVRRLVAERRGEVVERLELSEVQVGVIDPTRWEFRVPPDAVVGALAEDPALRQRLQALFNPGASRPAGRRAASRATASRPTASRPTVSQPVR